MIRQMRDSDWNEMMEIYKQSLERGDVTFRSECPTYEEWDRGHIKECRFVYELDGKVIGYNVLNNIELPVVYYREGQKTIKSVL